MKPSIILHYSEVVRIDKRFLLFCDRLSYHRTVNINFSAWLKEILVVMEAASKAIRTIAESKSFKTQSKKDQSPVTLADLRAHEIIVEGLRSIDPTIPIISEEGDDIPFEERKSWPYFWLVDPLDGTREFIRGSKEYSINIALIEGHSPILGVVAVPEQKHYYWAHKGSSAYLQSESGILTPLHSRKTFSFPIQIAVSRHTVEKINKFKLLESQHKNKESPSNDVTSLDLLSLNDHDNDHDGEDARLGNQWRELLRKLDNYELFFYGSSIKICLIAEGKLDLYPRFGLTGEWDTAAGQCILEAAGGKIVDLQGKVLQYNNKSNFINPPFLAVSCVELLSYIVDNSN